MVLSGTVAVAFGAALGTGNVTGRSLGTLAFPATTATAKSFAIGGGNITVAGGQTVKFSGGSVSAAYLDGAGTFATNGAQMVNVQTSPSVSVSSTSSADQFVHVTNSGALAFDAGTVGPVSVNGFISRRVQSTKIERMSGKIIDETNSRV